MEKDLYLDSLLCSACGLSDSAAERKILVCITRVKKSQMILIGFMAGLMAVLTHVLTSPGSLRSMGRS